MKPAARITDMHACPNHKGGPIEQGATSVKIAHEPAARVGDACKCEGPPDAIVKGSGTVKIENRPAARVGDPTSHGGVITLGCAKVLIGD